MSIGTTSPGYPAARAVAPVLADHFARHSAHPRQGGVVCSCPDAATLESVIDAAFWASLRREENYVPKISMALLPPADAERALLFAEPLRLTPSALVKIAPAVERPGIHLGVWHDQGELRVWGTTRSVPMFAFVLEVAAPGLLVVKHHRGEAGKFVNVAVLEGEHVKLIDEQTSNLPDCPPLLSSMLGLDTPSAWAGSLNVLVQIAASIRAHRRGGAMLVIPADTSTWRQSILWPMSYAVSPPYTDLADLMRQEREGKTGDGWDDDVREAVHALAGLTAVDGATIITDRFALLAFGAKMIRRDGMALVEEVTVTEPVQGSRKLIVHPTLLGGTRHLSAAQFVHDQKDAVALVASQDGRFTVFAWSPCEGMLYAHKVETLLL